VAAGQLVRGVQELGDEIELVAGETAGELRAPLGGYRAPDRVRAGIEVVGDLDLDPAAVRGITNPAGIAGALEPVDDARDGAGREARLRRQGAGRDTTAVLDDVQAVEVGEVDAERLGRAGVEGAVEVAACAERRDQRSDLGPL
jgi:hypothetical protein